MTTDASKFPGLEPDAQAALASVIDDYRPTAASNTPDVRGLVRVGFGWEISYALGRMVRDGAHAGMLVKMGLQPALARQIATACDTRRAERIAAQVAAAAPGVNTGRTMPRKSYRTSVETWHGEMPT